MLSIAVLAETYIVSGIGPVFSVSIILPLLYTKHIQSACRVIRYLYKAKYLQCSSLWLNYPYNYGYCNYYIVTNLSFCRIRS